jgi:N12 class adenine-specific DNA methylase
MAQVDQWLNSNVAALEAVIPKTIRISMIEIRMGSTWIPASVYEKFLMTVGFNDDKVT